MTVEHLSLIVTNARVRTGDPTRPWATALGIRDGKLAVVGSAAEILKMASTDTRLVDARGQLMELSPDIRSGTGIGTSVTVTIDTNGSVRLHTGNG